MNEILFKFQLHTRIDYLINDLYFKRYIGVSIKASHIKSSGVIKNYQ